jgi:hypothetical protein
MTLRRRTSGDQPDMVVRSAEGVRWGDMGRRMTRQQREQALDSLLAKLDQFIADLQEVEDWVDNE